MAYRGPSHAGVKMGTRSGPGNPLRAPGMGPAIVKGLKPLRKTRRKRGKR